MKHKWFSRKWLLVLLWFALLTYCCIKDGDMVASGFVKILAVTGGIVTSAFMLGNYLLQIENVRITHGNTSVDIKTKEAKDGKKNRSN